MLTFSKIMILWNKFCNYLYRYLDNYMHIYFPTNIVYFSITFFFYHLTFSTNYYKLIFNGSPNNKWEKKRIYVWISHSFLYFDFVIKLLILIKFSLIIFKYLHTNCSWKNSRLVSSSWPRSVYKLRNVWITTDPVFQNKLKIDFIY